MKLITIAPALAIINDTCGDKNFNPAKYNIQFIENPNRLPIMYLLNCVVMFPLF